MSGGGRFDFDDGGTYCGGWEDGKAHGNGVCTGPKGQGEYSGAWQYGFEASGVYTWPSGNCYEGQWTQGKRHGQGVEKKGHWVYRGEWTQGFKGRYGVRHSTGSGAKYEGTWTTGLQDGYGVETYADGVNRLPPSQRSPTDPTTPEVGKNVGTYQGQWLRGMRHGYGVRHSVPYGLASHYRPKGLRTSLTSLRSEAEDDNIVKDRDRKVDESRGGFVLKARSDESPGTRRKSIFDRTGRSSLRKSLLAGLKLRKQKSTGDIQETPRRPTGSVRSTISNTSHISGNSSNSGITSASLCTDSNLSFVSQDDITDVNVTETYMGEWKNDKRSGFGISERSDGLKYEGEWYNNKKYGYGVTTFKDGTKEEGKYKNNVLISSGKKSKLFLIRSSKLRDRVDNAVAAAQRAAQIAHQKADIAISRMANARSKSELADLAAEQARRDSDIARVKAKQFAPEFHQPGFEWQTSPSSGVQPAGRPSTGPDVNQTGNSALDCAIAGSSSHLVDNLHKYEPADIDRSYPAPPAGGGGGGMPPGGGRPPHVEANHRGPDPRYSDHPQHNYNDRTNAQSSRAQNREPAERLSTLLNSTTVTDHFDQYSTHSSQFDRDYESPIRSTPQHTVHAAPPPPPPGSYAQPQPPLPPSHISPHGSHTLDRSPMSHMPPERPTPSDDLHHTRPLQRRKTLPSIMKGLPESGAPAAANAVPRPGIIGETLSPPSAPVPPVELNRYVIEKGVRKRVQAEVYNRPTKPADPINRPKELPSRYRIETPLKLSKAAHRGSLPDVTACKELEQKVLPREEVSKMSERRRTELRMMQEEDERRRQQEIVLRLADFKDWCQQRQLLMLVIALNVSLATMFFNLLSQ